MKKILLSLGNSMLILIPIIIMILYSIFAKNVETKAPETDCEVTKDFCTVSVPENQVVIEFLENSYENVINQKDGNIPMDEFKRRLVYAINYKPQIKEYLMTDTYRYHLTQEAKEKAHELVDEDSYAFTVNNIHSWVLDNIEYSGERIWYTAESTWEKKTANCNGISFLACGMMREVGIPCLVVANDEHAWTEYMYVDDKGSIVWNIWDQGLEGYPALADNTYGYNLG